ncbi:MAG: efflux RND transporter periplasmic adaptor subunit [Saccharofermentanales bacterium]
MSKNKSKKKYGKRIFFTFLILIVAAIAIFIVRRPANIIKDVISPEKGDISTYYSFSGSIEAKNREVIFADQALQINEWLVKKGDTVKAGDLLYKTKFGAEKKAGIDGEILDINADINEQIMPGAKLLEIVDYSKYLLSIKVDEYDFTAIKVGEKAAVKINALSGDFTGTVEEISKEGIYMNGVTFFQATISIPANKQIHVGMSAEARVLNQEVKNVLLLPIESVLFDAANKPYVNTSVNNASVRKDLVLGITDGVNVEVKSGVASTDKIIVKKVNTLQNFRPGRNVE